MLKNTVLLLSLMLLSIGSVAAKECTEQYDPADQDYVKKLFVEISTTHLDRLHEIATISNQLDLTPGTQRAAMDAEYHARLDFITSVGDGDHVVGRRTVNFLATVVDADFLGLADTTVDGGDVPSAQANAYNAARRVAESLQLLLGCL